MICNGSFFFGPRCRTANEQDDDRKDLHLPPDRSELAIGGTKIQRSRY